ncbi:hypothetical protein ACX93W_18000 [Paenibacillus sp. CAU 1782]
MLIAESGHFKEIYENADGAIKDIGNRQSLDQFPITIHYKDGISETTKLFTGTTLTEGYQIMYTQKVFEQVINDKEIKSIVFFDREILIDN